MTTKMIRRSIGFDCEKPIEHPTPQPMMWPGIKVDQCCPMKTFGEEKVGGNVNNSAVFWSLTRGHLILIFS